MREDAVAERQAEEACIALVNSSSDVMYLVDESCRYLFANDQMLARLGVKTTDVIGRSYEEFHTPQESALFAETVRKVVAQVQSLQRQHQSERDNRYFLRTFSPVRDNSPEGKIFGVAVISKDITEHKLAEQALGESEMRYRSLFENLLSGFAYCRMLFENGLPRDFIYLEVNSAFEKLTGLKDVTGRRITEVIPHIRESNPELFEIYGRVALSGTSERFETYLPPLDIWLAISVYSTKKEYFIAIFENITERKMVEAELQLLAITDGLTGLYNRRGFITLAEQQLKQAERKQTDLVLLYMDLDEMKAINDTLGHVRGDAALREAALILQESFRKMDVLGRIGGDEFAVLAPETTPESSPAIEKRLQEHVEVHNAQPGRDFQISFSIGMAHYDATRPCSLDDLIHRADSAMYANKMNKRRQKIL